MSIEKDVENRVIKQREDRSPENSGLDCMLYLF